MINEFHAMVAVIVISIMLLAVILIPPAAFWVSNHIMASVDEQIRQEEDAKNAARDQEFEIWYKENK
jgi:beta-lactam-binding protein with PASTA domain